jgi:tetratricopeptide (TPR) repeat protein
MRSILVFIISFFISQSAHAAWYEASGENFVVYSENGEANARQLSEQLERYHNAMRINFRQPANKTSPSNRVTVFVLAGEKAIQKLLDKDDKYVSGFYIPRAGGSVAFVSKVDTKSYELSDSERTLLHEYAHHFMFSSFAGTYPLWLIEGFAEFYATAKFDRDGSVGLGLPALHRARELLTKPPIPLERMLDTQVYFASKTDKYDSMYGRSWLLFHYLTFTKNRSGQLDTFLKLMSGGTRDIDAAKQAFGDLGTLNKEINAYLKNNKWSYNKINGSALKPAPVNVRKLSDGEDAMMPFFIQNKRGSTQKTAQAILEDARRVAAGHTNDAAVLSTLAEVEFNAGNPKEALATADRAIAIEPKNMNAQLQKGYALMKMAPDMDDQDKTWAAVRKQFSLINRMETEHPVPLIQYYLSFRMQGKKPNDNAIKGLEWALALSPFDRNLRWNMSAHYMAEKQYKEAIETLGPLAFDPHKTSLTDRAIATLTVAKERLAAEPRAVTK